MSIGCMCSGRPMVVLKVVWVMLLTLTIGSERNGELTGQPSDSKGVTWEIYAVYTGFNDNKHA